jgi:hypothetical protein
LLKSNWGKFDHLSLDIVAVIVGFVVNFIVIVVGEALEASGTKIFLILRLVDLHFILI